MENIQASYVDQDKLKDFITFPVGFLIPNIFSNLNYNCYNLSDRRNLKEQVKKYLIFVFLKCFFLVSLLITTLPNRWMSGAMIAVSRCLYVVKSDIFDKVFARFNGKLLATGIWVISILHIIPVFLEVSTYRLYLFRNSYSSIN